MDAFISSFINSLMLLGGLWGQVKAVIPILAISVLFNLGVVLIKWIIWEIQAPDRKAREDRDWEHTKEVLSHAGEEWDID